MSGSMSRAGAEALASAKWRDVRNADDRYHVHAHVERDDNGESYRVGYWQFSGITIKGEGTSWRQACERAGLV